MSARVDVRDDHLVIHLPGLEGVASLRRTLVVPYSTIELAEVEAPSWPRLGDVRIGVHVPGQVAMGTFRERDGQRRFLDLGRDTERALRLRLDGHPEFDEIEIATSEGETVVSEVARHRPANVARPPVYE